MGARGGGSTYTTKCIHHTWNTYYINYYTSLTRVLGEPIVKCFVNLVLFYTVRGSKDVNKPAGNECVTRPFWFPPFIRHWFRPAKRAAAGGADEEYDDRDDDNTWTRCCIINIYDSRSQRSACKSGEGRLKKKTHPEGLLSILAVQCASTARAERISRLIEQTMARISYTHDAVVRFCGWLSACSNASFNIQVRYNALDSLGSRIE